MSAALLAKVTAKGMPLDGTNGGSPSMIQEQVAGCLAGCKPWPFLAIMAKYTGDEKAQAELFQILTGHMQNLIVKGGWKSTIGSNTLSRNIAAMLIAQFLAHKRISIRKRALMVGIDRETYRKTWQGRISPLEDQLNIWESEGVAYFTTRWHTE